LISVIHVRDDSDLLQAPIIDVCNAENITQSTQLNGSSIVQIGLNRNVANYSKTSFALFPFTNIDRE